MLQVFRVEHQKSRVGPFQTVDHFTQELATKANSLDYLPAPSDDGLPSLSNLPYGYVFGCTDMEALKRWFLLGDSPIENHRIIQTLAQKGFNLVEFLVEDPDYLVSTSLTQVAFDPTISREEGLVQVHNLNLLLGN